MCRRSAQRHDAGRVLSASGPSPPRSAFSQPFVGLSARHGLSKCQNCGGISTSVQAWCRMGRTSTSSWRHSSCKRLSLCFFFKFPFLLECQDGRTGAELSVRPTRFRSIPDRTASSFFRCCATGKAERSCKGRDFACTRSSQRTASAGMLAERSRSTRALL